MGGGETPSISPTRCLTTAAEHLTISNQILRAHLCLARSIQRINHRLVMIHDVVAFQLHGSSGHVIFRGPCFWTDCYLGRDFKFGQLLLFANLGKVLNHILRTGEASFGFSCDQSNTIRVERVLVKHHVVNQSRIPQHGFNFPITDVLALLVLDQILLTVNDLQHTICMELPNISSVEPPLAILVYLEVLSSLLWHFVIPLGNMSS
mmetsp:Transcript_111128/g.192739  ORF Transcript_111128/g.192739 Transcript_111128/m.192739 type:complete len:206 (+) Transcript_111128:265-882(+)